MYRKLSIAGAGIVLCVSGAYSQIMCVGLNSASVTCSNESYMAKTTRVAATCTVGSKTVSVSGIGLCSSNSGTKGNTRDFLSFDNSNINNNQHCWCRLATPIASEKFVFVATPVGGGGDAGWTTCRTFCSELCAKEIVAGHSTFRANLFTFKGD